MLARQKPFAFFCEAVVPGRDISETIIPEKAFAPFVKNGQIKRFSRDFLSPKSPYPGRYVCFTLPGQEWRADAFFWIKEECFAGRRPFDEAYEFFIGRLLGYEEADIRFFVETAAGQKKGSAL